MKKYFILFFFILLIFSCIRQQDQKRPGTVITTVIEAKGFLVPKDSMGEPKLVIIDENKLKKTSVGKPVIFPTNTNIHPAGQPKLVPAGKPGVSTMGQDTVPLPKTVPAIDHPLLAGIPEEVIAKDPYVKDQNPQNFSSFSKLQGLKYNAVLSLLQDKNGNLWLGTYGAGVSKYDGKSFTHYSEKEGLSGNLVTSMLEDRKGNLWFGTFGGLTKFDGKFMTNYTDKEGLANNNVRSMFEDSRGILWFGTDGGVSMYNGKTFTQYTTKEGLSGKIVSAIKGNPSGNLNTVSTIIEDKSGNLWFGTYGGGASRLDRDRRSFTHYTEKEGLVNNYIYSILEDKSGNIWIGTNGGGVSRLSPDGKSFTQYTVKEGLSGNTIPSILEDKTSDIWLSTYDMGVSRLSPDGKSFTHYSEKEGLSSNMIWPIFEDRSNNFWFGTYGGGISLLNRHGKSFTHYTTKEGLSSNLVYTIFADNSGDVWFGTWGGGISRLSRDRKSITWYTEKEGLASNYIYSIHDDKKGNLWFGTNNGISRLSMDRKSFTNYSEKDGLCSNFVVSILEDKNGDLWFGTWNEGVSQLSRDWKSFTNYTGIEKLSTSKVITIVEDHSGYIWFGLDGGLMRRNPDRKSFTYFTDKEGLLSNRINAIVEDGKGNLWLGTMGGGILRLDPDRRYFTQYSEKEGLVNDYVYSILEDKSGNIWFCTRFGLSMLTRDKTEEISGKTRLKTMKTADILFKNFTYDDGFLGFGSFSNVVAEDFTGTIWIGADDKVTAYHPPAGGEINDTVPPNIQVTAIDLFNEKIKWPDLEKNKNRSMTLGNGVIVSDFKFDGTSKWYNLPLHLSLAYNNNYLTFNFVGITMNSPKKVKYRYKLEGLDENWSAVTTQSDAPYGNLPPGHYIFKVRAMNCDGYWSHECNYSFTIRPPWWKTWWAYTLYFFIITGSIWYYIKWRERALKERQKVLEKTVKERTAEVVAEKKEVEKQKERSEELLLNILPEEVAEELKAKGSAEAKQFDEVTVMFTDFKGFTRISEKLSPTELVAEIHTCFKAFDNIVTRHNIEKIKTIGDSYMCAGGLPVANKTNASDVVNAALEIQQFMQEHYRQRMKDNKEIFEVRIGVHTGPVVAGIVGVKKFAYDIWGDTVNIASRMESSGEAGKVNISGTTYELVKDKFHFTHRGKIQAKNKGEIDMYFVEEKVRG